MRFTKSISYRLSIDFEYKTKMKRNLVQTYSIE